MKVLIACEESQRVCIEFRKLGHEAYSCDIEPCSGGHPEWHIQDDVLPLINGNCDFKTINGEKCKGKKIGWCEGMRNIKGGQKERAKVRSKTFPGIAKAMAERWG